MAYINTVVDKVYVINLDKDKDRMEKISKQLNDLNIEYTRFPAILGSKIVEHEYLSPACSIFCTDGIKGCALSHKFIWDDMLKNNYKNVLILEDDASLDSDFNALFQKGWDQLIATRKTFDIFYLGCNFKCSDTYTLPITINKIMNRNPKTVDRNILSSYGSIGTHGYIISNDCATFLKDKLVHTHIDAQIEFWINYYKLNAYSMNPTIVKTPIDDHDNGSNLSDSFPYLLNGGLRKIPISDSITLDWSLSESFLKLGIFNVNMLIVIFIIAIFCTPIKWVPIYFLWLAVEYLYSFDNKSAFKYLVFLLTAALVKVGIIFQMNSNSIKKIFKKYF